MRWTERPWRWIAGRSTLGARAPRIALGYAFFAMAWIYLSDRALLAMTQDPEQVVALSVYKGVAFVAVTAVLLLAIMLRAFGAIQSGYEALRAKERSLRDSRDELTLGSRMNAVASLINQALVRVPDREEAFDRACLALVRAGGFRLAWIGWTNARGAVPPIAMAGEAGPELRALISSSEFGGDRDLPAAAAARDGRPHVCNDISAAPPSPWRVAALREGLGAVAAFPIHEGTRSVGALVVCSAGTGPFRERELEMLADAAEDLSFGLEIRARDEARNEAQALARAEREFSTAMIESMPGIVYFYDERGRFLRWNSNFANVSGYADEEIARMHPLDFFAEADKPRVQARIADVFTHGEARVEADLISRDGRATPYVFTGRRIESRGSIWLVGVGIDMSERKAAETALRDAFATLEQKVDERTAELREAMARAESADRLKSTFLATMSHELRTPLNSIIGFTGIVLKGLAGPLNPEQSRQLGMVRASARHLLELINDVLQISKIEADQVEVRADRFDLRATVDKVAAAVRPLAERKSLALAVAAPPGPIEVVSDRRRVEQILLNLLGNAVKFTESGSIGLVLEPTAGGQSYRLRVSDTGIGVRTADLAKIFRPFHQVDTGLGRQHEGTGLGLSICQRLASLLGGEITVASQFGRGSEFTLVLPAKPGRPP